MSGPVQTRKTCTLEEFLARPDEKPYREFIDGRIEAKVSPQAQHSLLTMRLTTAVNAFAEPKDLGLALPEPRCVFEGRAIVPDVVYLLEDHIELDERGRFKNEINRPPDIHVEILSPDQSMRTSKEKLAHSTAHGCQLGWLLDPEREVVHVYRPGQPPEKLESDGILEADPVLPGFRLNVAEVFEWLKPRVRPSGTNPDPGAPSA